MDIWQKHSLALAACQEAKGAKKKNTLHINDGRSLSVWKMKLI